MRTTRAACPGKPAGAAAKNEKPRRRGALVQPVTRCGATVERRHWMNGISPVRICAGCSIRPPPWQAISGRSPGISRSAFPVPGPQCCASLAPFYACRGTPSTPIFSTALLNGRPAEKQALRMTSPSVHQAAAASAAAFSNTMPPFPASTRMVSFGPKRPSRISFASGFSSCAWIARFSGRAP